MAERAMHFDFSLLLQALGLALILEGIPYFLWAERMPSLFRILSQTRPMILRILGLLFLVSGLLLILVVRV
jgi:uncharacterized protein